MKTILLFGGSGSLGHKIIDKYIDTYNLVIYSRDENKHWQMRQLYKQYTNIKWVLGCIRDKENVELAIFKYKPNTIIIASALKHIDQCENNIDECIKTNITGVQNIINITYKYALCDQIPFLEKVLFVSTDKASSPVNAYGMCKSLSERMVIEKSNHVNSPKYIVVRYGNVLNSRGSLLPFFRNVAESKRPYFPVTDPKMTRFFMTLDDSVALIDTALNNADSGDTYIPRVPSYRIMDIAELFSKKYGKPIKIVGIRPGEKLREVLINITETHRTIINGEYYVIKPCYDNVTTPNVSFSEYTSETDVSNTVSLEKYI